MKSLHILFLLPFLLIGCNEPKEKASDKKPIPKAQTEQENVTLSFIDEEIYDAPVKAQLTQYWIVKGDLSKNSLTDALNKLYDRCKSRSEFKHHKNPTNIYIYLFKSKSEYETDKASWIAMADYTKALSDKLNINVSEGKLKSIIQGEQVKFGFNENKRKEIFNELVLAEDKARIAAEKKYPIPDATKPGYSNEKAMAVLKKQAEYMQNMELKFENEVYKKYGITDSIADQISLEGLTSKWPMKPPMQ